MRHLKTIIALVTLAAFAGRPALAALGPCCCVNKVEVTKTGCPTQRPAVEVKPPVAIEASHACCAPRQLAVPVLDTVVAEATVAESTVAESTGVIAAGCCCLKTPPAAPAPRDVARHTAEQAPMTPVAVVVDVFDLAPAARGVAYESVVPPLSGPPLLALYCIWRK
jgi:hypothetical protein